MEILASNAVSAFSKKKKKLKDEKDEPFCQEKMVSLFDAGTVLLKVKVGGKTEEQEGSITTAGPR